MRHPVFDLIGHLMFQGGIKNKLCVNEWNSCCIVAVIDGYMSLHVGVIDIDLMNIDLMNATQWL